MDSYVANLKEREAVLVEKGKRIEAMDANQLARDGRDKNEMKQRNARQVAEIIQEIAKLSPK